MFVAGFVALLSLSFATQSLNLCYCDYDFVFEGVANATCFNDMLSWSHANDYNCSSFGFFCCNRLPDNDISWPLQLTAWFVPSELAPSIYRACPWIPAPSSQLQLTFNASTQMAQLSFSSVVRRWGDSDSWTPSTTTSLVSRVGRSFLQGLQTPNVTAPDSVQGHLNVFRTLSLDAISYDYVVALWQPQDTGGSQCFFSFTSQRHTSGALPPGAIAGIIVASVVVGVFIVGLIIWRRKRRQASYSTL